LLHLRFLAMRASVLFLLATSAPAALASESIRAEDVYVPNLAVLPIGVGQMLPLEAYRLAGEFDKPYLKKKVTKASGSLPANQKNTVRKTASSTSLMQFYEEPLSQEGPQVSNSEPQEKKVTEKAIQPEVQNLENEQNIVAAGKSARKHVEAQVMPKGEVLSDGEEPDENVKVRAVRRKQKSSVHHTLQAGDATSYERSLHNDSTIDATLNSTISTKQASEAVKVAVDAAQEAARQAKVAQKAADIVSEAAATSSETNILSSSTGSTASASSSADGSGKATNSSEKEADSKDTSATSISMFVPSQVAQGMHIPTVVSPPNDIEESKEFVDATAKAVATEAANYASKMAQEAAKVAQNEAYKAATATAEAAAVTAAAVNAKGKGSVTKNLSETVADKAQEAQVAAIRATAAAKVAEQKAELATDIAAQAAQDTPIPQTEEGVERERESAGQMVEVPHNGVLISFMLGLIISVLMFGGMMFLFSCGDQLLKDHKMKQTWEDVR
jgi:hypothetical protein